MSDLKKVYVAGGPGDAHLLKGLLESAGIAVVIRGDDFVPLQGGSLFHLETRPSLWVLEEDLNRAAEIVSDYETRPAPSYGAAAGARVCPTCGEESEPQFTACWNCGASIEARDDPRR